VDSFPITMALHLPYPVLILSPKNYE